MAQAGYAEILAEVDSERRTVQHIIGGLEDNAT